MSGYKGNDSSPYRDLTVVAAAGEPFARGSESLKNRARGIPLHAIADLRNLPRPTDEQLQVIATAGGPVELVGPGREPLGSLTVFSPEERDAIVRFQRRSGTPIPGIPGERVQAFLRKLHEVAEREGIDESKIEELLQWCGNVCVGRGGVRARGSPGKN